MDVTKFVQSGYGCIFVETHEVKRAVNTIRVNSNLGKVVWNMVQGIVKDPFKDSANTECNQIEILERAATMNQTIVILENYDVFLSDVVTVQTFLNKYPLFKSNQVCLVIVGTDRNKVPTLMKELVPILEFGLPGVDEITEIANNISKISKAGLEAAHKDKRIDDDTYNKADFSVTKSTIDTCKALTVEEIENVLAYSARVHFTFDKKTILERKRDMLRSTGFMDFIEPEPLENLGGMDVFKNFVNSRKEPFDNPESIKPRVKSILLVGVQGCLAADTKILIKRGNRKTGRTYSIEDLYYRFNNIPRKGIGTGNNPFWTPDVSTITQCFIGDLSLGWNRINNVIYSGIKLTYTLTTESGKQIRATGDHPFLMINYSYKKLSELNVGDFIVCKDDHALRSHLGRKKGRKIVYSIPYHPFAQNHIINGYNYKRLPYSKILFEANLNKMHVNDFIAALRQNPEASKIFKFLLPGIVIHHKDGNPSNEVLSNYELMTKEDHDNLHRKEWHSFGANKVVNSEKIISIEEFGYEKVYDIQMEAPHHNFVANNIIVHNCGKSLAGKILCSIMNWPGILFDVGAVKGEYMGQTGKNMRMGTKVIDAVGNAIVIMDELEKAFEQTEFGGSKQSGGGAVADMIGHFLTWSQERTSEAIILATCNKIGALPPEFKRARRWDRIFFVDLPNPEEIKIIIEIKNRQFKSSIPTSPEFCLRLYNEGWSGAEIEQLAIDSHYDDIDVAMNQIPILYKHARTDIDAIRTEGTKYTRANKPYDETKKLTVKAVLKKERAVNFN